MDGLNENVFQLAISLNNVLIICNWAEYIIILMSHLMLHRFYQHSRKCTKEKKRSELHPVHVPVMDMDRKVR